METPTIAPRGITCWGCVGCVVCGACVAGLLTLVTGASTLSGVNI